MENKPLPREGAFRALFRYGLATVIVAGFFYLLTNISRIQVHSDMRDTLIMMIGVLAGKFSTIVDFEWGSSKSSQEKDQRNSSAQNLH